MVNFALGVLGLVFGAVGLIVFFQKWSALYDRWRSKGILAMGLAILVVASPILLALPMSGL